MEAANIFLIGSIIAFVFGAFLIYKLYHYTTTIKNEGRDRNYYYNRFMRNKEQVERYMESLQHSITLSNCGNEVFGDAKITANQHLSNLKNDYDKDYTEVTQNILKKNKLTRKDKRINIKLLTEQSEKLYNIEKVLREINEKYRS